MVNIKNIDANKIKIDEKSLKNVFIYYIGYYLYLIINKENKHIDVHDENKCLTLIHTYKGKGALKMYGELWNQ